MGMYTCGTWNCSQFISIELYHLQFEMAIEGRYIGEISFKLYDGEPVATLSMEHLRGLNQYRLDIAPRTCARFRSYVLGEHGVKYEGSWSFSLFPKVRIVP